MQATRRPTGWREKELSRRRAERPCAPGPRSLPAGAARPREGRDLPRPLRGSWCPDSVVTGTVLGPRWRASGRASLTGVCAPIALAAAWTVQGPDPRGGANKPSHAAHSLLRCWAGPRAIRGSGCPQGRAPDLTPEAMGVGRPLSQPRLPRGAHAWFRSQPPRGTPGICSRGESVLAARSGCRTEQMGGKPLRARVPAGDKPRGGKC